MENSNFLKFSFDIHAIKNIFADITLLFKDNFDALYGSGKYIEVEGCSQTKTMLWYPAKLRPMLKRMTRSNVASV